jgi:hypothetical protein
MIECTSGTSPPTSPIKREDLFPHEVVGEGVRGRCKAVQRHARIVGDPYVAKLIVSKVARPGGGPWEKEVRGRFATRGSIMRSCMFDVPRL